MFSSRKEERRPSFFANFIVIILFGMGCFYLGMHKERTKEVVEKSTPIVLKKAKESVPLIKKFVQKSISVGRSVYQEIQDANSSSQSKQEQPALNAVIESSDEMLTGAL